MRRDSVFPLSIQRGSIATPTVSLSYMVDASVGYIQVDMFGAYTHEEFSRAIESLQKQGMTKLIVDLRNNGGGYLDQAIKMLDECIEDNRLLLYTEGRKRKRKDYFSTRPGDFEDGELVVLTNSMSASASEIFAGAIQDWDRGLVIGQRTFGKGLVQEEFTLSNGDVMRLPVSKYYMPSGRCVQKPYEGKDAYEYGLEIVDRFESDEIVDSSAITLEDSTEYFTLIEGRTVYGGGGVIPDVFIPMDTGRVPFSRTFLRDASYTYFSKYREEIIGQWKNNSDAFFADSTWALLTVLEDTTMKSLSKEDKEWVSASLQNLYAGMIWMGNINRVALHKVDKHFQEAKRVLKQYEYAL
ncbi:MAG: S41 family peptidase, partial [Bacteroidota bacterium]|nr:S41 family peptidase [Bacteroidota bacterium]